jgi:hypothetical protein
MSKLYTFEEAAAIMDEMMSRPATQGEAAREYGANAGADQPERQWILTPWDTWERNPHYTGPDQGHPEYDD